VIGPLLSKSANEDKWGPVVSDSAQAITDAGFQVVAQNFPDPVTHQLGTIQDLGTLVKQVASSMRTNLQSWSTGLFNGQQDATGKSIM